MARLLPSALPPDVVMSERLTFEAFRSLPDGWTVLWDVPVGLFGRPKADVRQIDFLLLHEKRGVIVVEVKGGEIKAEAGDWWTRPMGTSAWKKLQRSPFKQAADQRHTLQRYLSERLRIDPRSFAHAVAFPGCDVISELGPDAPREIAIDVQDLRAPTAALHRVRTHWGDCPPLPPGAIESIVRLLRPDFEMTILQASVAAATSDALERETRRQVRMVEDQVAAYRSLLSTDRVVVLGGAGTGKTVIAAELARQLTDTGSRTLLLCHRAGVQTFLNTLLSMSSTKRSYDGNALDDLHVAAWVKVAGAVADVAGRKSVSVQDVALGDLFFEYRETLMKPYDALVIDEGQEFTPRQVEALLWLLDDPSSSPVYLFADPFQHSGIFTTALVDRLEKKVTYKWEPPLDADRVLLTTNCRNSAPIAEAASRFYPNPAPTAIVDGPPPTFHQVPDSDVLRETFRLVAQLISVEGFRPNQILVVVIGTPLNDAATPATRAHVGLIAVESLFRFPLTPKDLRVVVGRPDDVQGLEAEVTVVAHTQTEGAAGSSRELYISMSRARSVLHVVSNVSEEHLRERVLAAASEVEREREAAAT